MTQRATDVHDVPSASPKTPHARGGAGSQEQRPFRPHRGVDSDVRAHWVLSELHQFVCQNSHIFYWCTSRGLAARVTGRGLWQTAVPRDRRARRVVVGIHDAVPGIPARTVLGGSQKDGGEAATSLQSCPPSSPRQFTISRYNFLLRVRRWDKARRSLDTAIDMHQPMTMWGCRLILCGMGRTA